ncbi:MAG TPA: alginate export family protein [Myxococcota bacterium]|nr:alginate export family protein [Myxococcota bacterium]
MRLPAHVLALGSLLGTITVAATALADTPPSTASDSDSDAAAPERPKILFNRWQEDWSVLADPSLRTEPWDFLKYIPLWSQDPKSYASLGVTIRERIESNHAPSFGVGPGNGDTYLLDRLQFHADIRPDQHWQLFVQLEDVRAPWKDVITPVDENPLDLRQAFVAFTVPFAGGELKARVGRQEMAFDLQRFVSVRDGPNVRQAYDAAWLDWEKGPWRTIAFWSEPVQYRHGDPFDDFSGTDFQYGGFRVERNDIGPGSLAVYYSYFRLNEARYLFASGDERRNIVDVHYAGAKQGFDWDLEAMGQFGEVGDKTARAWGFGALGGYTFDSVWGRPRLGLQLDGASGDRRPNDDTIETFNPLFPNGYYFTLAGYTSYVNLFHLKPSLTVRVTPSVKLMAAVAGQWRETTDDAVYVQPNIPVAGTAGRPGQWSGIYGQLRADWAITPNVSVAFEAVHFDVGDAIQRAGGHDSDYFNVQLQLAF